MSRYVEEPAVGGVAIQSVAEQARGTRVPDFILGGLFVLDGMVVPRLGFPYSLLAVALLLLIGLTRQPRLPVTAKPWVPALIALALVYVAIVSANAQGIALSADWVKRLARIIAVIMLAMFIASERLHLGSMLRGLTVALGINLVAFYLHVAPDTYGGFLTGWLVDKNKSGMFYAVVSVMLLWQVRRRAARVLLTGAFFIPIWLTGSRTSITAYVMGIAWTWLVAARPWPVRWLAAGGTWLLINYLENNFAQAGAFENRVGTDLLRERIALATAQKLAAAPPQGYGLGEAVVEVQGSTWYFHDALATLRAEGGYFYFALILGVTVLVGLRPFKTLRPAYQGMVGQGATITLLICAWKLGEVFLTLPWALLLGLSFNYLLKGEPSEDAEGALLFDRDHEAQDNQALLSGARPEEL